MKILHVTPEAPGYKSGGTIAVYETTYVLTNICKYVDYIGPEIKDDEIKKSYARTFFLKKTNNPFDLLVTVLHRQNNKSYISWKNLSIDFTQYDYIFVEFAKHDYVIKDIKKNDLSANIFLRIHNVEQDFAKADYISNKNLKKKIILSNIRRHEEYMVKNANKIIALTKEDAERICLLYGIQRKNIYVIPICVKEPPNLDISSHGKKIQGLITGSLWFGPNVDGIMWFLNEIYPYIKDYCELTIAGFRPNKTIKKACTSLEIKLIDSPHNMDICYGNADAIIAPIFDGSGMKVKVGEALSYGKAVFTTPHGAIGYKIENGVNGYVANSKKEFIKYINDYYQKNENDRLAIRENAYNLYRRYYSLDICKNKMKELLIYKGG